MLATKCDITNNNHLSDNDEPSNISFDNDDDVADPYWKDTETRSSDTYDYPMDNNEIDHQNVIETNVTES
ncbi:hypothetical protein DPMN_155315 [Dreissena polymorpha]|uniref:Uncharacterized protein n=1 Tax=Dreissena polymorpha TaxID=45954 RepID=A0A9D4FNM4_DREPO|nr:hypothetical protein DPMN_155315 [Dreissena polymorpha]